MSHKKLILGLFITLQSIAPSQARWATYEDADSEVEFYNEEVMVHKDGTFTKTIELQQKVLKESFKDTAAHYIQYYNGASSKIKILEAKTIHNGKSYPIKKDAIEDKPLASAPSGFDQGRQILFAFPNIDIGSSVYIKYIEKCTKPVLKGFFSKKLHFGDGGYLKKSHRRICSELPLHCEINDPQKALCVKKNKEGSCNILTIDLTKPIYIETVNEPRESRLNEQHHVWVNISSLKDWKSLAAQLAPRYIEVIDQPLPSLFKEIVEKAQNESGSINQINTVTSLVIDKIRYMGDWRTVKGSYFPRSLAKIAGSQLGDCKDFSVATASILKKLGYKVNVVWVNRGIVSLFTLKNLPNWCFNHAMLKVVDKEDKVFWIDPTNEVSMAQGLFPDIANKIALVLDTELPGYEQIPQINPSHYKIMHTKVLNINGKVITHSGVVNMQGKASYHWTGQKLYVSDQIIKDYMFNWVSNGTFIEEKNKKEMIIPDLSSRTVKDLTFKYKYDQDSQSTKTNLGQAIAIFDLDHWLYNIIYSPDNQVADMFIGTPKTYSARYIINNTRAEKVENLNYEITSPWIDVKRSCIYEGKHTIIDDRVVIKTSFISSEALNSAAYKSLKKSLMQNIKDTSIILGTFDLSSSPSGNSIQSKQKV